jgi:hypothetical protein
MSTPCIVTREKNPTLALYIHWDGDDKDMVQAIVDLAKSHNARNVNFDEEYGMARLCCAAGEYFDNEATGFGVCLPKNVSYNYHWVIDENWKVKKGRL